SFGFLIFGLASLFLLVYLLKPFLENRRLLFLYNLELTIHFQGIVKKVVAILDTGNHLQEPVSGRPVIIVHYKALEEMLPEELKQLYQGKNHNKLEYAEQLLSHSSFASRLHIIPYNSVNNSGGFLIGFRPDQVQIEEKGRKLQILRKVIIGIGDLSAGNDGKYQALLPPGIVETTAFSQRLQQNF
ncbi:MAG: sigma-E processing peptidase SpoIIGA, partial [Dethiobacteria bacterium]